MKKEILIDEIEMMKNYYETRNKQAGKKLPLEFTWTEYGEWQYENAVKTFTEMIIKDLQHIIDEIEAPF